MKAKNNMNALKKIEPMNWLKSLINSAQVLNIDNLRIEQNIEDIAVKNKLGIIDGENCINIWNKGETEIGRMLAHFYYSPFLHPYYGPFNSMEGFWHYIQTIEKDDRLRNLSGIEAKSRRKILTQAYVPGFCEIINEANFIKIEQNPKMKKLFIESELPFEFYYLYGAGNILIRPKGCGWLVDGFELSRKLMKNGERLPEVKYA